MLNALPLPETDPLHLQIYTQTQRDTILIDTGLRLPFERQLKYRINCMGWRCCVNYYPFPPLYDT